MMFGMDDAIRKLASRCVAAVGLGAATILVGLGGCGSPNRHRIETGDLTARPTGGGTIELAPRIDVGGIGGASPRSTSTLSVDAESARGGVGSIRVTAGEPDEPMFVVTDEQGAAGVDDEGPSVVGQLMIDSVVGQINGRPVFASEFFEPMDARFAAQAKTLSARRWLEMAQGEIQGRLRDQIRDELLLAEFESGLSVQQRSGLLFFVSQIRENLVSANRGSEELLAEKLQSEEGVTISEKVEAERRKALIREQLRNKLGDKAYVAWRDVLLQYKQDEAVYNPSPTAHFRMIQIAGDDLPALDRVETALANGESFADVARRESVFRAARGGEFDVELTSARYEDSRLFGPDVLNDAAAGLAAGEIAGPVVMDNGRLVWIQLESLESSATSLYDAQFAIFDSLRTERILEEEAKYFQGLIDRSSLSPIQEMEQRLLDIATERYLIDQAP